MIKEILSISQYCLIAALPFTTSLSILAETHENQTIQQNGKKYREEILRATSMEERKEIILRHQAESDERLRRLKIEHPEIFTSSTSAPPSANSTTYRIERRDGVVVFDGVVQENEKPIRKLKESPAPTTPEKRER